MQQLSATLCACALLCMAVWTYRLGITAAAGKPAAQDRKYDSAASGGPKDIIRLKNGSRLVGHIVWSRGKTLVLTWEGGTVTLGKEEIKVIEWAKSGASEKDAETVYWPYRHNPIVKLTNQHVLDGQIMEVRGEYIVLREELKTDSYIEYQIQRERIEAIEFSSFAAARSSTVQRALFQCFPKLSEYEALMKYSKAVFTPEKAFSGDKSYGFLSKIWGAVTGR